MNKTAEQPSAFALAEKFRHKHLIVQPSDLALNPPESYLFVQDGLIISCGVLYALCYLFYMVRTYRDKYLSGTVYYLTGTMAYEIYYAVTTTSTTFERMCFFVWFVLDMCFAATAISCAYPAPSRPKVVKRMTGGVLVGLVVFYYLCKFYPDEREQLTAYWTGLLLQLPIGWGAVHLLLTTRSTKGQSLEIWITRYLGCFTAYGVFVWRYLNAPQNWAYVASWWSVVIIVVTLIPETMYPFVYVWAYRKEKEREMMRKVKENGKAE